MTQVVTQVATEVVTEAATHVATLLADPATRLLGEQHLRRAAAILPGARPARWLAAGIAADIPFAPTDALDLRLCGEAVRAALDGAPVDAVVQPAAGRRKHLLVADMDSTLIHQECIDELAEAVGLRERVAALTERSMRGEIAFAPALHERVGLLRGIAYETAVRIFHERITFVPGGRALVATMRAHGAATAIASGGFTLFTGLVAEALGFEAHHANVLVVADGRLAGTVEEPILDRDAKARILRRLRDERGLAPADTMAVGDGANDLAMLAEAGIGIAFHAKPAVAAAAAARIDHADLTALLYLQGYSEADLVAA